MESICQGLRAKINISSRESRFDELSEAFETASPPFLVTFKSWFCIWVLPPPSPLPNAHRSCTLSLPFISVWVSLPPGFLNLGCPHVSICLVLFYQIQWFCSLTTNGHRLQLNWAQCLDYFWQATEDWQLVTGFYHYQVTRTRFQMKCHHAHSTRLWLSERTHSVHPNGTTF